jgi:hypothetical protein
VTIVVSAGRVLRLICFLAVLGFLTVVLIGPVLALVLGSLAIILGLLIAAAPFIVIGLGVWGVFVALSPERRGAWQQLRTRAGAIGHWAVTVPPSACRKVCTWGYGAGRKLAPIAVPAARRAGEVARDGVEAGVALAERGAARARSAAQIVGGIVLEVIGGAAVGIILVCLADSSPRGPILGIHIAAGAIAGALLGLLVGAARASLNPERG